MPDDVVKRVLSTADVGLSPDPKNPLNDVSTMNKTLEYMAFELPVAAFDLLETRVSAGEAAMYAVPNLVESFAKVIVDLIDDEPRRKEMGRSGGTGSRPSWPGCISDRTTSACTTRCCGRSRSVPRPAPRKKNGA